MTNHRFYSTPLLLYPLPYIIHPPSHLKVEHGNECGLQLGKFKEWLPDDVVECFRVEWVNRQMDVASGASGSLLSASGTVGSGQKK